MQNYDIGRGLTNSTYYIDPIVENGYRGQTGVTRENYRQAHVLFLAADVFMNDGHSGKSIKALDWNTSTIDLFLAIANAQHVGIEVDVYQLLSRKSRVIFYRILNKIAVTTARVNGLVLEFVRAAITGKLQTARSALSNIRGTSAPFNTTTTLELALSGQRSYDLSKEPKLTFPHRHKKSLIIAIKLQMFLDPYDREIALEVVEKFINWQYD